MKIKLSDIIPDPNQPRKTFDTEKLGELQSSFSNLGLIQPITVRSTDNGNYMIVVGERRYRASKEAGLSEVECVIREDIDDKKAREMQFTENSQQEDVNPIELGTSFIAYRESYHKSQRELSDIIGIKLSTIADFEQLASNAGASVRHYVMSGDLDTSTAQEISVVKDEIKQSQIAQIVVDKGLNRAAVRKMLPIIKAQPTKSIESVVAQALYGIETEKKNGQAILNEIKRQGTDPIAPPIGKFSTITIDPPWPIEKILRNERPNQFDIDYSKGVMTLEEIANLPIQDLASENGCHIYLWTTHKHLPDALDLFNSWDISYQCLLTWSKNVGFTPFSWMYSTEHCLFGHIGSLPLLQLGKRLDFQAKVREHSRKPDEFYELVRQVSPEPRIDMFGREKHEGFEVWGNEANKFSKVEAGTK